MKDIVNQLIELYYSDEEITLDEIFSSKYFIHDGDKVKFNDFILSEKDFVSVRKAVVSRIEEEEKHNDYEYEHEHELFPSLSCSKPYYTEHKKYVQAYITNISVPKTLKELYVHFLDGNSAQGLINDISYGNTCWTAPKWVKRGDIVLFMHAKYANQPLTAMRTKLQTLKMPGWKKKKLNNAIADQLKFHKQYGGKIYAIGRIIGKPYDVNEQIDDLHFQTRTYCDIDRLFLLQNPIDLSEFNDFIKISRLSATTPVYGESYDRLKELIINKNDVREYFRNSCSTPFPHNVINSENWMKLGLEYRRSFTLEEQFRACYANYLLSFVGDQKKIFMECSCYKKNKPITFVDNIIKINGKLLPVEIKLNIDTEPHLDAQCNQYCHLYKLVLDKKNRLAQMDKVISDKVLVIDTYAVYMYDSNTNAINYLYDLDNIHTKEDINKLRKIIIKEIV